MPKGYETANGTFDPTVNTLFINKEMLQSQPEYEQMFYLFHELRHALQYLHPERFDELISRSRLYVIEQTSLDLKILLKVLRSSTAFEELTPTLVNSLIRRIEVHNNDKSSGHCSVKVDIYFTAIGLIDIPTEDEIKILMEKIQSNPQEYRLTA